jgi:hypothetical protein
MQPLIPMALRFQPLIKRIEHIKTGTFFERPGSLQAFFDE